MPFQGWISSIFFFLYPLYQAYDSLSVWNTKAQRIQALVDSKYFLGTKTIDHKNGLKPWDRQLNQWKDSYYKISEGSGYWPLYTFLYLYIDRNTRIDIFAYFSSLTFNSDLILSCNTSLLYCTCLIYSL